MRSFGIAAVILAAILALFVAPSQVHAVPALILSNASVFDVYTRKMFPSTSIIISDTGIITSVQPSSTPLSKPLLSSAPRVIDCTNQFVIPGLIDGHVHTSSQWPQNDTAMIELLEWTLRGGVTSVRDMGGDALFISPFATRATIASVASPRIYYSALIGGPDFFLDPRCIDAAHGFTAGAVPWLKAIVNDTNCEQAIIEARNVGATGIKIYGDLNADRSAAITAAARKLKFRSWAHAAVFPAKPSELMAAGVESLSHSAYLVWEPTDPMPDDYRMRFSGDYKKYPYNSPNITSLLRAMAKAGTLLDATLFVFSQENDTVMYEWSAAVTSLAAAIGVRITAGTDDIGDGSVHQLPNIHHELQLLVNDAHLLPSEAIRAATLHNAIQLGIDSFYGSISAGKVADLLILSANPLQDISATQRLVSVIKQGVVFTPTTTKY